VFNIKLQSFINYVSAAMGRVVMAGEECKAGRTGDRELWRVVEPARALSKNVENDIT
jgi:hypothetical protein